MAPKRTTGFTLVEVLIALAITALVATIAYTGLSTVMTGAERLRDNADRIYELNRAFMILSRDLRQFTARPVRDEFGDIEPAFTGGELARFELSFTRTGWYNPNNHPRSTLQRVNYRLEDEGLWRDTYPVLDRAANTEPESALLLDGVESIHVVFLGSLETLQIEPGSGAVDTRNWVENWVSDNSGVQGAVLAPPSAVEITLQLKGWGEMKRLYALPPL
jgi:general secretion pathway protein J